MMDVYEGMKRKVTNLVHHAAFLHICFYFNPQSRRFPQAEVDLSKGDVLYFYLCKL